MALGKQSACTCLALIVVGFAATVHRLANYTAEFRDPGPVVPLRRATRLNPRDGAAQARLALALLKPTPEVPPTADEGSLYGSDYVLAHPDAEEARAAMDEALRLRPGASETHLAHQAVLMAEGRAEEAIQPGRKAIELAPKLAKGYVELARSHLAAACAQGCGARMDLREEKKSEKRSGKKSALEAREEEARSQEVPRRARRKKSPCLPAARRGCSRSRCRSCRTRWWRAC